MASENNVYSLDNEAFVSLLRYSSLVLFKIMLMPVIIATARTLSNKFLNEEDARALGGKTKEEDIKACLSQSPLIDRVRRCHSNDIENAIPFVVISLLYISVRPDVATVSVLFKTFAYSRIVYTAVYLFGKQPFRTISYLVGYLVNLYMVGSILLTFWF